MRCIFCAIPIAENEVTYDHALGPSCEPCHKARVLRTKRGQKEVPAVVIESIKQSFPKNAAEILGLLEWDSINRCFYFNMWGMCVGVETDGYIHT